MAEATARIGVPAGSREERLFAELARQCIGNGTRRRHQILRRALVNIQPPPVSGEKVVPADMEMAIVAHPLLKQAYCFGNKRPSVACMVVPTGGPGSGRRRHWIWILRRRVTAAADRGEGVVRPRIKQLIKDFPYYAQSRTVEFTREAWILGNADHADAEVKAGKIGEAV